MKPDHWLAEVPLLIAIAVNGVLGAVLGALLAGLRGGQVGLVAGIGLALAPSAVRTVGSYFARPNCLPRFVGREIGAVVLRIASSIIGLIGLVLAPVVAALRIPVVLVGVVAYLAASLITALLTTAGRTLGTPLGLGNLAALLIIAGDLAHLEIASVAVFLGFVVMIILLFVSEFEARMAAPPSP